MPVMYNTGDWFSLRPGNTFRKIELYNLNWPSDFDLDKMLVYGAPYGGPIALVRDFKQILEWKGNMYPEIYIVTCAGVPISKFKWKYGDLLTMGWTEKEELVCVQSDGLVYIYDMLGNEKHSFSMGKEANDTKVISAKIFPTQAGHGVAVMTSTFRIFFIKNVGIPSGVIQMPEIPQKHVNSIQWEIVTDKQNIFCLIAMEKELLMLVDGQTVRSTHISLFEKEFKSIISMSVSFNHRYLAIYTNNGIVWLGTTDLKTKFCEFDTGRSESPKQIEWILDPENCRQSDAVIISYPFLLLILNTNGDSTTLIYDPSIFLIPELDGVRVLTYTLHELIQKVPVCVSNIFSINSQEPASFLFEAHKKFLEKSHQSDEYLNLIRNNLSEAVNECIEAAGYEFDTDTQKVLVKAAYFGKALIPFHNPDNYVSMCRKLRVLNNLRLTKVGLPLTYQQFCNLKVHVVLDRLVFRKHYAIAVQVAKHLKLPESGILEHWAFYKIQSDRDDKNVARKIIEKFKNLTVQEVSFCNIAEKAYSVDRHNLAYELLDLEPKASNQVPLLLKLQKYKEALQSAIKSGDTDLIYTVLLKLKVIRDMEPSFDFLLSKQPIALELFKKYCKICEKSTLENILSNADFRSQAEFKLREGIENNDKNSYILASAAYDNGRYNIEAELCRDLKKLINTQQNLSQDYGGNRQFYGLTIHETLENLLRVGDLKTAEKFKNEYKIPDKRYWWARIQILAENSQWDELQKFSKYKKSPVGYEPFVEVCLQMSKIEEAEKYIINCRDDKKIKWYIRAGKLNEAADLAFDQKDSNSLQTIKRKAVKNNEIDLLEKVNNLSNKLLKVK